jgi:pyruvate formate lyase activating enzyme
MTRYAFTLGGMVPFSTVDFPGRLAAVLFAQGCPLACRYCQNPHLRRRGLTYAKEWDEAVAWLERRRGLLDAVVLSGGEPTMHHGLIRALGDVRQLGFATGLHSAGTYPRRLAEALPLLDWIGLDVKAPFSRYDEVTGHAEAGALAKQALDLIVASGISYEIRTTVHAALLSPAHLEAMAAELHEHGVKRWVLQVFQPTGCVDAELLTEPSDYPFESLLPTLRNAVPEIVVR